MIDVEQRLHLFCLSLELGVRPCVLTPPLLEHSGHEPIHCPPHGMWQKSELKLDRNKDHQARWADGLHVVMHLSRSQNVVYVQNIVAEDG